MNKRIIIFSTVAFLLVSCDRAINNVETTSCTKKVNLSIYEYVSVAFDENNELSDNEIKNVVSSFLQSNTQKKRTTPLNMKITKKTHIQNPTLKTKSLLNNSINKIPICEVIIEDQDTKNTALICTDSRFPLVYAFYTNGKEERHDMTSHNLLIEGAKEIIFDNINRIELLKDSLRSLTYNKIAAELSLNVDDLTFESMKDYIVVSNKSTRSQIIDEETINKDTGLAKYGPYINVRWDCGMPYNRKLPQACPDNWLWDNRYAVGSGVVAIAQILSFYRPTINAEGTVIDWSYLCENKEIHEESDYFGSYAQDPLKRRDMIASLMKYIGTQCQVMYNCSGSSVYINKVVEFLKTFGVNMSSAKTMNLKTLKGGIDNIHPVLISGNTSNNQGHFWIVDGYCTQVSTRGDTFFPGYDVYFHANMGQGKSYTGYYLAGSDGTLTFDTTFAHFVKNFKIYTLSK